MPGVSEPDLRQRLPRTRESPARARHSARRLLLDAGVEQEAVDRVELVVSELVTNACKYGRGEIELRLALRRDWVGVEVIDQGRGPIPEVCAAGSRSIGGWGLRVVAALSCCWGADVQVATDLWAWLPAHPEGQSADGCR
jgi:anti-sigma regulatory factor (Ser/Thr protein kinase)